MTYGPGAFGSKGSIFQVLFCIAAGRTSPYLQIMTHVSTALQIGYVQYIPNRHVSLLAETADDIGRRANRVRFTLIHALNQADLKDNRTDILVVRLSIGAGVAWLPSQQIDNV